MSVNDGDMNIESLLDASEEINLTVDRAYREGLAALNRQLRTKAKAEAADGGYSSDIKFCIPGWLLFIYWLMNILYVTGGVLWSINIGNSYRNLGNIWQPLVAVSLLMLFNRLGYEVAIAIFEIVKHLRQIRDELRIATLAESAFSSDNAGLSLESSGEGSVRKTETPPQIK